MTRLDLTQRRNLWRAEDGATAVEFALVIPIFVLLTIGAIGMSTMTAMNSALHFAVEKAARCASVSATSGTGCVDQGTTSTYALASYKGPTISGLTFTLTPAAGGTCGNKVVGTGTYVLVTGLRTINVAVRAQACYPITSSAT